MSWNPSEPPSAVRARFIAATNTDHVVLAELCRQYGISRKTAYKWLHRHAQGEILEDRCRRPLKHGNETPQPLVDAIVDIRTRHPRLGGGKIAIMLRRKGVEHVPSGTTVTNILRKRGLLDPRAVAEAKRYVRFEKKRPNEMWQTDFKGDFLLKTGERCYPLNIIDDCTRYCLRSVPLLGQYCEMAIPVFESAMRSFGRPLSLLCDNGNPWGVSQRQGMTAFEAWLMEHDILPIHGKPLHPQTQGKQEAYNKTLKRELIETSSAMDMTDIASEMEWFRNFYNEERPHYGIGGKCPADLYVKSERPYEAVVPRWDYPSGAKVLRVNSGGCIQIDGKSVFLTRGLAGKDVGVRESASPGCLNVFFRNFIVARYSASKGEYEFLRAYRIVGDPRPTFPGAL